MPPTRIKESCLPCRQRRSRCDGQLPCAPCNVHGTGSECNYASGRANGATRRSASPPRVAATSSSPASVGEVYQLRSSVQSLEARIESLEAQLGFRTSTPRVTTEDADRWRRFKQALPPLGTCEILLDYVTVECDWLWWPADVIPIWKGANEREACTPGEAGNMAMSLAYAALLLGVSSMYKVDIAPNLHEEMFELAKEFTTGEGTLELDAMCAMVMYIIYAGRIEEVKPYVDACFTMAIHMDLLDESRASWRNLTWEETENRRRVAWEVIVQSRWSHLEIPHPPGQTIYDMSLNVRQPRWTSYPTEPLHLADSNPLRVFRVKSGAENARTGLVKSLMVDYTSIFARLHAYLNSEPSALECQSIYREIVHRRDVQLPASGFDDPSVSAVDFSDPISARDAAQRIIMHHSFGHLLFITLRHWLTDTSNDPLVQTLREASVDGAMRTMSTVPLVKAFATSQYGPFISPFAASNLFSAAMIFAVPILRAVKSANAAGELDALQDPWQSVKKPLDKTKTPLPPSAFTDPTIKYCANNILLLLDAMIVLKDNPLREVVEEKLAMIIDKYGLRQSQPEMPPPAPAPSQEWMNPFPWPTGEPEQDVLQQLLQMDTAVWQAWLGGG